MKYISLFTGIGGFDLGFDAAGMECVGQVEMDKHCQHVLRSHWPNVTKIEDVRNVTADTFCRPDVICGGFPCQDLSVAGKRAGLAGERSGLWSEFARIIDLFKPKFVVIENVPGLLSSNSGRDMAVILRWLEDNGYRWAYRILDSQYFGVAQRRRRVFIVASLGDGSCAEVLFESESLRRNPAEGRKTGEGTTADVAPCLGASGRGFSRTGETRGQDPVVAVPDTCGTLDFGGHGGSYNGQDVYQDRLIPISIRTANTNANGHGIAEDKAHTLDGAQGQAVAFHISHGQAHKKEVIPTLCANEGPNRHQGFSNTDFTAVCFQQNTRDEVREVGDKIAGCLASQPGMKQQNYIAFDTTQVTSKSNYSNPKPGDPCHPLASGAHPPAVCYFGMDGDVPKDQTISETLHQKMGTGGGNVPLVQKCAGFSAGNSSGARSIGYEEELSPPVRSSASGTNQAPTVSGQFGVRRLTPTECERLQAFPDGHTAWGVNENGERVDISDTQRYRMLGNAVTASVGEWIGKRIKGRTAPIIKR